jgi:hypothetical protein
LLEKLDNLMTSKQASTDIGFATDGFKAVVLQKICFFWQVCAVHCALCGVCDPREIAENQNVFG